MRLLNTAILKLLIYLTSGILLGFYFPGKFPPNSLFYALCLNTALSGLALQLNQKKWFEGLTLLFFMLWGYWSIQSLESRLINYEQTLVAEFTVTASFKPTSYYERYKVKLVPSQPTQHAIPLIARMNINDSLCKPLTPGSTYRAVTTMKPLPLPYSPGSFDYGTYLKKKGIKGLLEVHPGTVTPLPPSRNLTSFFHELNNRISNHLTASGIDHFTFGLISALTLGDRDHMDREYYQTLKDIGGSHLIALSGLHIGIFTYMIGVLLWPLRRLSHGRTFQFIILILTLSFYTLLTGGSASVIRAGVMFSLLSYSILLQRGSFTPNSLILSAFILLLANPFFLFDPGFQLSYSAVIGILLLYPVFKNFYRPKNRVLQFFRDLIMISVAAQLFTTPIAIYYFGQFPGSFLLTNLALTPLISLFLILSYAVIAVCLFSIPPAFLIESADLLSSLINKLTYFLNFENFIVRELSAPDLPVIILIYLIYILLIASINERGYIKGALICVLALQFSCIKSQYKKPESRVKIRHAYRRSIIERSTQDQTTLYHYPSHRTPALIHNVDSEQLPSGTRSASYYFKQGEKELLVIDGLCNYLPASGESLYILLINSAPVNLDRILSSLSPRMVIADGSNYPGAVDSWRRTCAKKNIPFHYTGEKGYYILE